MAVGSASSATQKEDGSLPNQNENRRNGCGGHDRGKGALSDKSLSRAAAIDIGTNSIKLVVADSDGAGVFSPVEDRVTMARLGAGLNRTGLLSDDAQDRAIAAIRDHLITARELGAVSVRAVATSAVREASNGARFVERAESELGLAIEVVSGEEEARLSYLAAALDPVANPGGGRLVVIDVGGGSTEVASGSGLALALSASIRVGAVTLTEQCLKTDPPTAAEIARAAESADRLIAQCGVIGSLRGPTNGVRVVAVGGAAVNLARIHVRVPPEETPAAHGTRITAAEIGVILGRLSRMEISRRKTVIGLDPDRADVIVGGAIILQRLLASVGCVDLTVSVRGLRHGILLQMLQCAAGENWDCPKR